MTNKGDHVTEDKRLNSVSCCKKDAQCWQGVKLDSKQNIGRAFETR